MSLFGNMLGNIFDKITSTIDKIKAPFSSTDMPNKTQSSPSPAPHPPTLNGIDYSKMPKATVIVKSTQGTVKETIKNAINYNGALYDPITLKILADHHGPDGVYNADDWESKWDQSSQTAIFTQKKKKSTSNNNNISSSNNITVTKPPKIEFNEPFPTFSSTLKKIERYVYFFGVDSIKFKNITYSKDSSFLSQATKVNGDYIMLEAKYTGDIEFSILDNKLEIPILPIGVSSISNELLFYNQSTRFLIDNSFPHSIKKNGVTTQMKYSSLHELNSSDWENNVYHIDYKPLLKNTHKPISQEIYIKAILRGELSSIQSISVRCYIENQDQGR